MHPIKSGQGHFPRYGGGWMHQFGHVYALQQELLNPEAQNWFRAAELYHTARHEGLALNCAHYGNMLRQCVRPAAWEQALRVLGIMARERVRPDVPGCAAALAACAEARRRQEVERLFAQFSKVMLLDSVCFLALIRARLEDGDARAAVEAGAAQADAGVPFLPHTYTCLLEAAGALGEPALALEYARDMRAGGWRPDSRGSAVLRRLAAQHEDLRHELGDMLEGAEAQLEGSSSISRGEKEEREEEGLHLPLPLPSEPRRGGGNSDLRI